MDQKNNNDKKHMETTTKVTKKTFVAQRIGIAIAMLAFISGVIGVSLALWGGGGTVPGSFSLLSPENVAAKVGTSGSQGINVNLFWNASSGAEWYDVYLGAGLPGKMVKIARVSRGEIIPSTSLPLALEMLGVRPALAAQTYGYTASSIKPQTLYYWKIVAVNSYGSRSSSTWSFTTITDFTWFKTDTKTFIGSCTGLVTGLPAWCKPEVAAACGGQRGCDAQDPANALDCVEFQRVWNICSSYTNKCPDNLADECMQMSLCQCKGIAPGSADCSNYLSTLPDPCA